MIYIYISFIDLYPFLKAQNIFEIPWRNQVIQLFLNSFSYVLLRGKMFFTKIILLHENLSFM